MYVCVFACEEDVHEKTFIRKQKRKRNGNDKKKKRKRKIEKKLIHTDKQVNRQTDRRTDGQIDTNHSLM